MQPKHYRIGLTFLRREGTLKVITFLRIRDMKLQKKRFETSIASFIKCAIQIEQSISLEYEIHPFSAVNGVNDLYYITCSVFLPSQALYHVERGKYCL